MPSAGVEQEQHAGKALGRAPGCCLDAFKISSKGSQDGNHDILPEEIQQIKFDETS